MSTDERKAELRDRIRQWDDIRRDQFGAALGLFITLAAAGLGFTEETYAHQHSTRGGNFLLGAMILFGIAMIAGSVCMLTRLRDFRVTAKTLRSQLINDSEVDLDQLSEEAEKWGKSSWILLRVLVIGFLFGVLFLSLQFALFGGPGAQA